MISLRARINLMAVVSIATMAYCAWRGWYGLEEWDHLQAQVRATDELRTQILDLPEHRFDQSTLHHLQKVRNQMEPGERQTALANILSSYSSQDDKILRTQTRAFFNSEGARVRALMHQEQADRQTWQQFIWLATIAPTLGLALVLLTVRNRIFTSLGRLSRRMMDFLVDRYTFQFSQPESNELGDLQRTFNSLAQRVINTMDELKRLDQAKSEFLSIASHELRTPMTSIKGSLSLLATGVMGNIDPSCMKLIRVAEIETDRLIRLINDLLDLAKIEAGKLPLASEWRSWNSILNTTMEGLDGLARKAGVRLEISSGPALDVFMDRDRIQQVLTNLVSNAIKFSPEGGVVRIVTGYTKSGELLVNVCDQGVGISAEDQEILFQKFRQGSSAENPLVKGTGLGLAIAKALVEEHGGMIGVESRVGHGSAFWFTLPKWREAVTNDSNKAAS